MMFGKHSMRKRSQPEESTEPNTMVSWYCRIYNKSFQKSEATNNFVHKLTPDKLQLVLVEMQIRSIFEQ